jgi:hypothetical protein
MLERIKQTRVGEILLGENSKVRKFMSGKAPWLVATSALLLGCVIVVWSHVRIRPTTNYEAIFNWGFIVGFILIYLIAAPIFIAKSAGDTLFLDKETVLYGKCLKLYTDCGQNRDSNARAGGFDPGIPDWLPQKIYSYYKELLLYYEQQMALAAKEASQRGTPLSDDALVGKFATADGEIHRFTKRDIEEMQKKCTNFAPPTKIRRPE